MQDSPTPLAKAVNIFLWVGIFGFFGYVLYQILGWLLFGAGFQVLILAAFVGVVYVIGSFPDWIAKRSGQTRWEAERSLQLFVLFLVGVVMGTYWIPKYMHFNLTWYWRVLLGLAMGWFALATRRYR